MKEIEKHLTGRTKKHYESPKIEVIADVKKITKGVTIGQSDSGGQNGPVPSDPG